MRTYKLFKLKLDNNEKCFEWIGRQKMEKSLELAIIYMNNLTDQ